MVDNITGFAFCILHFALLFCFLNVTCCSCVLLYRAEDENISSKRKGDNYVYSSIEDEELEMLLSLPRHDNVVELLGLLLDAKQPGFFF